MARNIETDKMEAMLARCGRAGISPEDIARGVARGARRVNKATQQLTAEVKEKQARLSKIVSG